MTTTLMPTSPLLTDTDLAAMVADASFLWERLDATRFAVAPNPSDAAEIARRCERWRQTVAHENQLEILQKRVQWEGLNLDDIRPRLGNVQLVPGQPLPGWAETLRQMMHAAAEFEAQASATWPTDSDHPIPFEDMWLPALHAARQQLAARLDARSHPGAARALLSEDAYVALERSLLQRLSLLSTKTLDAKFSQRRPVGQQLLNALGIDDEAEPGTTQYRQFIDEHRQDGFRRLFQTYPVLGRLIAVSVDLWVSATAELIQRLNADHADIQRVFGSAPLGNVTAIQASLSDPHNCGRTVMLLTFASGLKLVYKPKDSGLEVAWNQLLTWCNQQGDLLDFKVIQVLNREGYGWVEYVDHAPCADEAAVERFFQRAGMLLCLIYILRGTDCHHENLIASGEHLVLIDIESLLQHEPHLIEDSPDMHVFGAESAQQFWDSVLRTGMLPRWSFSADQRVAFDISGLGGTETQQVHRQMPRWQAVNTDNMHLRPETVFLPVEKNVPHLGDCPQSPQDYHPQIVTGFEQMYRFLMQRQSALLAPAGPLAALQHQQVRFILRATRIYFTLLHKAWRPESLQHGVDYSIELDYLSRAFVVAEARPDAWPLVKAELRAMEQLDIPFFTANTSGDDLPLAPLPDLPQYFKQPSYQDVVSQLQTLDEATLAQQVAIIQGAFYARVAQPSAVESQPWQADEPVRLSAEQLIQAARDIAADLEARALPDRDGGLNWFGMGFVPQAERFQLQVLNDSSYDGRSGIALFLAGLYHVTREPHFRDLARRSLQPCRHQLHNLSTPARQRMARIMGIGGAAGISSMIYALVKISQFTEDAALLTDAHLLADQITPDLIAADRAFDLISGAAGGILGLLALYDATGEMAVLEKAIACGQHLLQHQTHPDTGPKAWKTIAEKPLAGFSHGAAGIAYALLRLYATTQEASYRAAALQGIAYEQSVFSAERANWPDLRDMHPVDNPAFVVQWCHGAAGIGLGRLASWAILNPTGGGDQATRGIEQDITVALRATQQQRLKIIDHVCCGNLGLSEVLLVAAHHDQRPDWQQAALQNASAVVARAQAAGGYRLFANLSPTVFNPGFFQGAAGIGYQFLRLAQAELPSVLLWA